MSEASENLKKMMAAHPEIKKLAEQKTAMRDVLISKGFNVELFADKLKNFSEYADMIAALDFSIDSVIEENGYTHDFGDGLTLSRMMKEKLTRNEVLSSMDCYKANDFKDDTLITYLTVKPLSEDMTNFCNGASNLIYVPQLDFSIVKRIDNTFANINPKIYIHDVYELDLTNCTSYKSNGISFCKKLVLKNMRSDCELYQTFAGNMTIESIEGLNVSAAKSTIWNLWGWGSTGTNTAPSRVSLSDDCIIQSANVLCGTEKDPGSPLTKLDKFDAETLYGFCTHAYDWKTNPRGLTKVDGITLINGHKSVNYYNYRFSDAAKTKLAESYPGVDFEKMMEDKGWTY